MITESSNADGAKVPFNALVHFLLVAFGLAWGILGLFIFAPDQMAELFGELTGQHPLFFLAVYAPAIAAFLVVTHYGGVGGLQCFLARLLLWRCSWAWYAFLIIGIPVLFFSGSALSRFRFLHFIRWLQQCFSWPSKARLKSLAGAGWLCLCCYGS